MKQEALQMVHVRGMVGVCKVANSQVSQYLISHSPLDDSQAVIVEELM